MKKEIVKPSPVAEEKLNRTRGELSERDIADDKLHAEILKNLNAHFNEGDKKAMGKVHSLMIKKG